MWLKVIIWILSIAMVAWLWFEEDEKDFFRPPRSNAPYAAVLSLLIIVMMFDVASSVGKYRQDTEKVYAEYEVVDKFTTIKKGEVYYYVELVYIDDYELYDDKDQNIIHELKRYSDYEYHNKGSIIKIEIKVVIPK